MTAMLISQYKLNHKLIKSKKSVKPHTQDCGIS